MIRQLYIKYLFTALVFSVALANAHAATLQKGDPGREQIMNAMRPAAETDLGAPVEFVVRELTVSDGWAFVRASAQHKGGGKISWLNTPYFRAMGYKKKGDIENALSVMPDCCSVQSILHWTKRSGWSVVEQSDTSTAAWWESYCKKPARTVIQKFCKG